MRTERVRASRVARATISIGVGMLAIIAVPAAWADVEEDHPYYSTSTEWWQPWDWYDDGVDTGIDAPSEINDSYGFFDRTYDREYGWHYDPNATRWEYGRHYDPDQEKTVTGWYKVRGDWKYGWHYDYYTDDWYDNDFDTWYYR